MTLGLSPKVVNPLLTFVAIGVALVVLGAVLHDDTLRALGYGALGSALGGGAIGHQSSPGEVALHQGPASDDELAPAVTRKLKAVTR